MGYHTAVRFWTWYKPYLDQTTANTLVNSLYFTQFTKRNLGFGQFKTQLWAFIWNKFCDLMSGREGIFWMYKISIWCSVRSIVMPLSWQSFWEDYGSALSAKKAQNDVQPVNKTGKWAMGLNTHNCISTKALYYSRFNSQPTDSSHSRWENNVSPCHYTP
jgi:hypothetical protein